MAFTDHCDIFASFHEDGFNRILDHVRRQRPSLFNYGTADVAANRELWCKSIEAHPIVGLRQNPLMTVVDPLPVPGSNYGLNFLVQLTELRLDFHKGDEFELPPELSPPLKEQRFALKLTVCGGIGCPPRDILDRLIPPPPKPDDKQKPAPGRDPNGATAPPPREPVILLPTRQIQCFCLSAFAVGGIRIARYHERDYLEPFLDGVEIVDIKPPGLENSLECYLSVLLKLVVLPGLRLLLPAAALNLTQGATDFFPQPTNIKIKPTPVSANVPFNPAIEQDQLKAFINIEVLP